MYDLGVSRHYTVILALPLSFMLFNLTKHIPIVAYEPGKLTRFGISRNVTQHWSAGLRQVVVASFTTQTHGTSSTPQAQSLLIRWRVA
jgi:hypothetical protein